MSETAGTENMRLARKAGVKKLKTGMIAKDLIQRLSETEVKK